MGLGGFTTHDLARCRLAARLLALFYDWWNIFVRLAEPGLHREAITSRPLFLSAIATRTRHARQTTIRVTSRRQGQPAAKALAAVAEFLRGLAENAEQLTRLHSSKVDCCARRRVSRQADATRARKIAERRYLKPTNCGF